MLYRNRFLVLLALAGLLAFLSLSLQFCEYGGALRTAGGQTASLGNAGPGLVGSQETRGMFIAGAHGERLQAGVLTDISSFLEPRSHSVAQTSLKLMLRLPQPPRPVSPHSHPDS